MKRQGKHETLPYAFGGIPVGKKPTHAKVKRQPKPAAEACERWCTELSQRFGSEGPSVAVGWEEHILFRGKTRLKRWLKGGWKHIYFPGGVETWFLLVEIWNLLYDFAIFSRTMGSDDFAERCLLFQMFFLQTWWIGLTGEVATKREQLGFEPGVTEACDWVNWVWIVWFIQGYCLVPCFFCGKTVKSTMR